MILTQKFFTVITKDRFALAGFLFLVFFFTLAVFAPWVAPYSFSEVHEGFVKTPPVWMEGGTARFLLGTDDLGRDFLSRLIYGARFSIGLGLMVVLLSVMAGVALGLLAGFTGGVLDRVIMSAVDIMMSFPGILLAIVIVAILGPGLFNTVVAVNIMAWPAVIRIVRAEVVKEKNKDYVLALKGFGAGAGRLMCRHILPNISGPLIVQAILGFSEAVLNIAALGFLGLGARPPLPEWGTMISDGRDLMTDSYWLVVFPGLCILLVVLSFNVLGGALRDTLDPKAVMG